MPPLIYIAILFPAYTIYTGTQFCSKYVIISTYNACLLYTSSVYKRQVKKITSAKDMEKLPHALLFHMHLKN